MGSIGFFWFFLVVALIAVAWLARSPRRRSVSSRPPQGDLRSAERPVEDQGPPTQPR